MTKIKLSKNLLTVNGVRAGIWICGGPWVDGVPAEMIKIRCKRNMFPRSFRDALSIENNSDAITDYFEGDSIKLMPGHPLYETAKSLL